MQTKSDTELLREYAANQSEAAFGEIVRRYADFVYSAALRQVGDAEQARDVAQTVFVALARKAGSLRENILLIGWLCQGARLAALEHLRNQRRRLQRERQAMELLDPSPEIPNDWHAVRPVLDEAIASLGHEDRDALLLRFFKNESLASVGTRLGVSEDAAQKRISRALGKLRDFLAQRGINTTATALSAALAANAVQAAPAGFAASLTAGALAKAVVAGSSTVPLLKLLTLNNMKTAILSLVVAGGIAGLAYQQLNTQRQLREARTSIQQQAQEIQTLRAANEQLAAQTNDLENLRGQAQDVLRLRSEVTRLRQEQAAWETAASRETPALGANSPTNSVEPPILINAEFVSLPDKYLKEISTEWSPLSGGGTMSLLSPQQFNTINEALKDASDVEIISRPRVQTANDVEAELFAGRDVPFGNSHTNLGEIFRVNPHYSTNSPVVELNLNAQISELVDTSALQDGSDPNVRATIITNSVSVLDGQTIVLQTEITGDGQALGSTNLVTGPRSLLVFITPQINPHFTTRLQSIIRRGDATH
jgi:RNA polymerase sigma factor (sigma-70 family)